MSMHVATISWARHHEGFAYETYDRDHAWRFGSGATVAASAAPRYRGSATRVNPEEAFVAAISSCHMLSFLALAARGGMVVDRYDDEACGVLEPDAERHLAVTRVTLRPKVVFGGDAKPTKLEIVALHDRAHDECFIAQSVKTQITVEPIDG